jgi:hypothetical protein
MQVVKSEHVVGKHNPHLEKLLRLTADEALFARNHEHRDSLYALITEPLTIEPKFVDPYTAENYLNLDILSNAAHFLPISGTARRFFVPTVSAARVGDRDYFTAIEKQMVNEGGLEALLYHLLYEIDLRDFDVRAVPKIAGLREQAAYSRTGVDLLVEKACSEARVPCCGRWATHAKAEELANFTLCSNELDREGFDHFIDHHPDPVLKRYGSLRVKDLLKNEWGCITGKQARRNDGNTRMSGIVWPALAKLREMFVRKYGPQHWHNDEATNWELQHFEIGGPDDKQKSDR